MARINLLSLLAAAALVLAATPARMAEAQQLGPLCARLSQQLNVPENLVSGYINSLPLIPSQGFCPWLTQNLTETQACDMLTLVQFGLTGGGKLSAPECPEDKQFANQAAPAGNLTRLADRRPIPAEFTDPTAQLKAEGATYFWLFRMAANVLSYTRCQDQLGPVEEGLVVPPGWEAEIIANLTQADGALPPLPLVFLLRNPETNQLVITVRSTMSTSEWARDFETNQTTSPEITDIFGEDADIAYGFASVFEEVWPAIQAVLDDQVISAEPGEVPDVWVTGHSMGAAVGNLVVYASQQYLNEKMEADKAPLINTVVFAPPQVGGPAFVERFSKLVNGRGITFVDDIVQQFPCDPEMPACPATPSGILGTLGVRGIATNQNNVTEWQYKTTDGVVSFSSKDMPQDAATWARINSVPLCWATTYLYAAHTCSYMCLLSSYSPEPVDNNQCWLSTKPEGASGSQCPMFPAPGYLGADTGAPAPTSAPAMGGAEAAAPPAASTPPSAAVAQHASTAGLLLAALLAAVAVAA